MKSCRRERMKLKSENNKLNIGIYVKDVKVLAEEMF
jgi:hypothetical protein